MKSRFSLGTFLGLSFFSAILIQVLGILLVLHLFSYQSHLSVALNISGRQRMLTQKLTKEIFIYVKNPTPEARERFLKSAELFNRSLYALRNGSEEMMLARLTDARAIRKWKECEEVWKKFYYHVQELARTTPGTPEFERHLTYIREHNLEVLQKAHAFVLALQSLSLRRIRYTEIFLGAFLLVAIIGASGSFLLVKRWFLGPFTRFVFGFEKMASGDLTVEFEEAPRIREIQILSLAARRLRTAFGEAFATIRAQTDLQKATSGIIQEAISRVAQETTRTDELATQVANISRSVQEALELTTHSARELSQAINEISENVTVAAQASEEARNKAEAADAAMKGLSERTREVDVVVQTIKEITEQTKLLALNATIEAARAGEAGKGFAVVANEVKELAKQTEEATERITRVMENIRSGAEETAEAVTEISSAVADLSDRAAAIASAVEEQTAVVNDLTHRIEDVSGEAIELSKVSDDLAHSGKALDRAVSQVQASLEALDDTVKSSHETIQLFRLGQKPAELFTLDEKTLPKVVLLGHRGWAARFIEAVLRGRAPAVERDARRCLLGRALSHPRFSPLFREIEEDHARLHSLVSEWERYLRENQPDPMERINWFKERLRPLLDRICGYVKTRVSA
ncbi:MAG TPA: hypothetical protein ENJ40_03160 [Thermosulfurimonas dismutans]|uniref:Methyl-accepting transducer domain-containing protein n=1 Tax=Thermosulfurimonas dismutans TaxID=999894 RepID=A0A7C3H403_9BACT|nr:hypothetical protein [Thermosulfurimonas dismutans]